MPPVVMASTFAQPEPGKPLRFDYSRSGNPTRANLEAALAALATCSNPEDPRIAAAAARTIARMTAPPTTPADKEPKADAD